MPASPPSRRLLLAAATALASLAAAVPAGAGVYTVRQCDYTTGNHFHDFRWQASGSPAIAQYVGSSCGEFGLAARNGNGGTAQTYPSGGYGGWFAYAPGGTVFTHFAGAFGVLAGCCINGMATYAEAANGSAVRSYLFQGNLGNNSWYAPSGLQGPVGRSWSSSASGFSAKSVGFYLRCGPGFSCPQGRTGDLRLRGRSFDFTLRDDVPPSVAVPGGTLLSGGWLHGTRTLSFAASDVGGGLTAVTAGFDDGTGLSSPSACTVVAGRYARLQPCPLGRSSSWAIDTAKLPDGVRTVTVRTTDAGGASAQRTHTVSVDNTAPAAPLGPAVVGGEGWRRVNGFTARWSNPGGQHAPIVKARFSACPAGSAWPPADPSDCLTGERSAVGASDSGPVTLPSAGQWDLRAWLEDAAGNADPRSASPPLRLRFDPDPPLLSFGAPDPAHPARVTVYAADRSGIVAGGIELRSLGSRTWTALPTVRDGGLLTTTIDDGGLPRGHYELRARATDAAGNQGFATGGGRTLPVRAPTQLRAAVIERVARARLGCRPRRAPACRADVVVRRARVRARHGTAVVVRGELRTTSGQPLADRRVAVTLVSRDRVARLPDARSDDAGALVLVMRARRSAVVVLRFGGDGGALASERRLAVEVPAPVSFLARRNAVGGRPALFRGRVRGGGIPRQGKLVEVQAHFRGRWRTISAVRSARGGRWRFAYTFRAHGRSAGYRFRARVPGEAGYPFSVGTSRAVRVTVRPR